MPYSSSSSGATDGVRAAGAGGGVVPYPALPAHSRVGTPGAAASPRHTAPRAVGAAPSGLRCTLTFHHAVANSSSLLSALALGPLGCFSRDGDPLFSGDT